VIFNVNFKTLSSLIKSAFVDYELYRYQNARYNDKNHLSCLTLFTYWGMGILIFIGIRWVGVPPPCLPREDNIVSKLVF